MKRALLVAAIACAGCTYDFDAYLPRFADVTDGEVDSTPACTLDGGDSCYSAAKSCAATCTSTRTTCEAGCTNNGCRNNCRNAETTCKNNCVNDCTNCTTGLGCATRARCVTEVG